MLDQKSRLISGHNHPVVLLTKKSAAGKVRGACSRQERILPDTFSVPCLLAAEGHPRARTKHLKSLEVSVARFQIRTGNVGTGKRNGITRRTEAN